MNTFKQGPSRRNVLAAAAAAATAPLAAWAQSADSFPARPITFIVAFPAGSGSDGIARQFATKASQILGVPVVVENRPGAAAMLATRQVARMKPGDGYTFFLGNNGMWLVQPAVERNLGYSLDDFAHLMMVGEMPFVLLTRPDRGWANLADMVAEAKRRPGAIAYGSTGVGGTQHLVMEQLAKVAGIRLNHIPYKGPPQAQTDILGGHIDLLFDSTSSGVATVRSGRLIPLCVSSRQRMEQLPNVATVAEQGYPNFSLYGWWSLETPAGVPPAILDKLSKAFATALDSKEMKSYFYDNGILPTPTTRDYLMGRMASEGPMFATLIKDLNIKADS